MTMSKRQVKTFRDFILWQKVHLLARSVRALTKQVGRDSAGMTDSITRSCMSASAAVADAFEVSQVAQKVRLLNVAKSSVAESQYYLNQANNMKLVNTHMRLIESDQVMMLVETYRSALNNKRS